MQESRYQENRVGYLFIVMASIVIVLAGIKSASLDCFSSCRKI